MVFFMYVANCTTMYVWCPNCPRYLERRSVRFELLATLGSKPRTPSLVPSLLANWLTGQLLDPTRDGANPVSHGFSLVFVWRGCGQGSSSRGVTHDSRLCSSVRMYVMYMYMHTYPLPTPYPLPPTPLVLSAYIYVHSLIVVCIFTF